jgi:hypothetical protein
VPTPKGAVGYVLEAISLVWVDLTNGVLLRQPGCTCSHAAQRKVFLLNQWHIPTGFHRTREDGVVSEDGLEAMTMEEANKWWRAQQQ